jgi:hypothetical protein
MARFPSHPFCDGALLAAFESHVRDSDVFCSTAPKSGQTWLMTLMYHLVTRGHDPDMGGRGLLEVMPWLELAWDTARNERVADGGPYDRDARIAQLDALADPRIFKLHLPYDAIPIPPGSRARIVTITRDLRDLPYSIYCHVRGLGQIPATMPFTAFFDNWLPQAIVFDVIGSFWPHRGNANLLWLRYEDMHADLPGQARRVAAFLGITLDDADLDRVLPLVSLTHLQATEARLLAADPNTRSEKWLPGTRFFREGAVGKNRAQLDAEREERLLERARERLGAECFDFVMNAS